MKLSKTHIGAVVKTGKIMASFILICAYWSKDNKSVSLFQTCSAVIFSLFEFVLWSTRFRFLSVFVALVAVRSLPSLRWTAGMYEYEQIRMTGFVFSFILSVNVPHFMHRSGIIHTGKILVIWVFDQLRARCFASRFLKVLRWSTLLFCCPQAVKWSSELLLMP